MIKFFRKTRQRLLTENKFGKYSLYAIGEIMLVVIGILIALQINNWNDRQKDNCRETEILLQLKEGLTVDKDKMESELESLSKIQLSIKGLETLLENPNHPYSPELDSLFGPVYGMKDIKLNKAFYEDLKISRIQLIKNESLKGKVINLFEDNYAELMGLINFEIHVNEIIRPYYLSNFQDITFSTYAHPIEYNKIWKDPYFKNIVNYRYITFEKIT